MTEKSIVNSWFNIKRLDADTFAISESQHWEEPNCYLLLGKKKALLIDTGLGVANIKAIVDSLSSLPVTAVSTHVHWDHIGGHSLFENIAVHEAEIDWLSGAFPLSLQAVKNNLLAKACELPEDFDIDSYSVYQGGAHRILHDGDCFDLGDRQVYVIHTPGHSPGHCCFYEPERRYLYSGDLIYSGCLDAYYPSTDPKLFFSSVQKINSLNVSRLFPGHHRLDISPDLTRAVEKAFSKLKTEDKLCHGSGIFEFDGFQIHI